MPVFGNGAGCGGPLAKMLESMRHSSLTFSPRMTDDFGHGQLRHLWGTANTSRELSVVHIVRLVEEFCDHLDELGHGTQTAKLIRGGILACSGTLWTNLGQGVVSRGNFEAPVPATSVADEYGFVSSTAGSILRTDERSMLSS